MPRSTLVSPLAQPKVQPLFAQIRELIVERIKSGEWKPGEPLPSETEFGVFYNVSQGTVRKAIAEMAAENLVVRFRGKGTFVTSQSEEREHSHFFHLVPDDGAKEPPTTRQVACRRRKASKEIAAKLGLEPGVEVSVITRVRHIRGKPRVFETITVSDAFLPDLCASSPDSLPNELYPHYEQVYDIRVIEAEEHLKAIAASEEEAAMLGVETGAPLLEIDRVALTYERKPVEWRRSLCNSDGYHYVSKLK